MADNPAPMGLGGNLSDLISTIKGAVQNLSALNTTLQNAFPRISGSFTLSAATTTVVTQNAISATSLVFLTPTNGTAGLILRTNGLFHSANTPGASFTLSTQAGSATTGGTFEYFVINPS
jgi:hypothetical protein